MPKFFIFLFIAFFTITSSIIFFTDSKKEEAFKIKDKNVERVIQKNIHTTKEDYLSKSKVKEEKEKFLQSKEKEIEKKSKELDVLISKTDKLIEDNNLKIPEPSYNKENKKRVDELNKEFEKLKEKIGKL